MKKQALKALVAKFEAEEKEAKFNLGVYLQSPTGIGEHGQILEEMANHVDKAAAARDKIEWLNNNYETE